jgi:hypothetical protein
VCVCVCMALVDVRACGVELELSFLTALCVLGGLLW